ncbi:MAG: hypothetical protein LBP74_10765 [Treponema sp.]|jgi:hypothetical protein|nr:hypothetical protein [Treponema sp.]
MITLQNSTEPDSLICQFIGLVEKFINEKTPYKFCGVHEADTDSKKVMRLSVFVAERDYDYREDGGACWIELEGYYTNHRFPWLDDESSQSSRVKD